VPSPPLVIPNAVQVRLVEIIPGGVMTNVLHGRKAAGATVGQALADSLGAAIKTAWTTHMASISAAGSALVNIYVRDLTTPNQSEYLDSSAAVLGTDPGDALPPATACCITLKTALAGKSFRGRVYLGGFTETSNAAGGVGAGGVGAAGVAYLTAIQAAFTASGLTLAVCSRPAYAYQDVRTWQLPEGNERVDVIGNGLAKAGGLADVTIIQSRSDAWESQRRRGSAGGAAATLINAQRPTSFVGADRATPPRK